MGNPLCPQLGHVLGLLLPCLTLPCHHLQHFLFYERFVPLRSFLRASRLACSGPCMVHHHESYSLPPPWTARLVLPHIHASTLTRVLAECGTMPTVCGHYPVVSRYHLDRWVAACTPGSRGHHSSCR